MSTQNSRAKKDFQKINKVLMGVINRALAYFVHHDDCYKKFCLQLSAWDGIEELKKMDASFSEPFFTPVISCLQECAEARKTMPDINIRFKEEFPVAARSLIELSQQLDRIIESDRSITEGIDKDDLATGLMFTNLAELASQM